jgi:hypothetical protein
MVADERPSTNQPIAFMPLPLCRLPGLLASFEWPSAPEPIDHRLFRRSLIGQGGQPAPCGVQPVTARLIGGSNRCQVTAHGVKAQLKNIHPAVPRSFDPADGESKACSHNIVSETYQSSRLMHR